MASWIKGKPVIKMRMYLNKGFEDVKYEGVKYFEIVSVSDDMSFTGKMKLDDVKWFQEAKNYFPISVSKTIDGSGQVHENGITLQGIYYTEDKERQCIGELEPQENGTLEGTIFCRHPHPDSKSNDFLKYLAVVDYWYVPQEPQ